MSSTGHRSCGWCMSSTSWLRCNTSQCRHTLTHEQHDPCHPHQRIVSFRTQHLQLGISALLPNQWRRQQIQQRHHSKPCQHIKHVMFMVSEAELASLYYGCILAIPICTTLDKMGHTQPPMPVTSDNVTSQGLTIGTMTPKASKSMDKQFHWFKCHSHIGIRQFLYLWCCGILNQADYARKHHAPKHHQAVCPFLIFDFLLTQ